jgi:hypothetical protein
MLDRSFPEPHRSWAGPGDRQIGWWLSLPLGIINGRVARRQIAEQPLFVMLYRLVYISFAESSVLAYSIQYTLFVILLNVQCTLYNNPFSALCPTPSHR